MGLLRTRALEAGHSPAVPCLCLACASGREEMLKRYLACPWDSGDWLGALEADIQTFVWRDTRVSSSLGFCTFRKKAFCQKILINSFQMLQYCAVIKRMDFRARQPWFVDQLCHLPAEGLCQVTTSMSLHSVIFLSYHLNDQAKQVSSQQKFWGFFKMVT